MRLQLASPKHVRAGGRVISRGQEQIRRSEPAIYRLACRS